MGRQLYGSKSLKGTKSHETRTTSQEKERQVHRRFVQRGVMVRGSSGGNGKITNVGCAGGRTVVGSRDVRE